MSKRGGVAAHGLGSGPASCKYWAEEVELPGVDSSGCKAAAGCVRIRTQIGKSGKERRRGRLAD